MAQAVVSYNPEFEDLVRNEVRRAVSNLDAFQPVASGVAIATFPTAFKSLAETWCRRPPIYVHHVFPLDVRVPADPLERQLPQAAARLKLTSEPAIAQVRLLWHWPATAAARAEAAVEAALRVPVDWRAPRQIVSVVVTEREILMGACQRHWTVSPWPGGAFPTPPDRARINRSELKLMEALETFRIPLKPGQRALDLGASPGGWTRVLLSRGLYVVSVDPDPLAVQHPRLTAVRMTAQAYAALGDGPFDVVTNDMILAPRESCRLMVAIAPHVRSHAVVTLKLSHRNRPRIMDHCFRLLRSAYRIPRVRQLFYNKSEVTLWLRPAREREA